MNKITIQTEPIDIAAVLHETGTDNDGAVVIFVGRARNTSRGKEVTHLDYEAYGEMALSELEKIGSRAIETWSLSDCIIIHRYGKVEIGTPSIIIAVSSPHRNEAYEASRYIIDTIKKTVPIWKKEFYTDGSEWISDRS